MNIIACPSCARQNFDVIGTVNELERRLEDVKTCIDVSIIGCIVNGPGEAKEVDVGLIGGTPNHLMYENGKNDRKLQTETMVDELEKMIRRKVARKEAELQEQANKA